MHSTFWLTTAIASIVAFGSWLCEDVLFYRFLSKKSIGVVYLLKLAFAIPTFIALILGAAILHYGSLDTFFTEGNLELLKHFIDNNSTVYLLIIGMIISSFINFFKIIQQKVGHENFFKIILGYYKTPREEDRIFIFIDLISSTQFAEILGHKKYSPFIQECFRGIGLLQVKYRGSQYQFVGDEVVISWSAKRKKNYRNAVDFFFEFNRQFIERADFFRNEFGIVPNFSASINSGKIMMAEVGDLKSELAFHGDVLNTAARIQKQCKSHGKEILVTGQFIDHFKEVSNGYLIEFIANEQLSGKKRRVDIYTVSPVANPNNDAELSE
jgi:adenylate cyclase